MNTMQGIAVALGAALVAGGAQAQEKWPTKPIRMVVPFTTSAASDVLSRILVQRLTEIYGQSVVVDNRPGAGGMIGSEITRHAAPDGYTFAMVGQPHISNALVRSDAPYHPLKDYVSVGLVAATPNIITVGKTITAKNIPDLIALAKAKPGTLNYGSAGVGSSSHLAGALFVSKAGINVVHVPFRQGADSRTALITGTIHFYVYPLPAIMNMVRPGTIRALAVTTAKRADALPDVPTTAEAGFGEYRSESWFGVIGPRALPKRIVDRVNADIVRVLAEPATREKVIAQGAEPRGGSPAQFEKMQRDEYIELGALIKQVGMRADRNN
jgi:tripartite-type tricarboxylate transporter receptor subunit TctC